MVSYGDNVGPSGDSGDDREVRAGDRAGSARPARHQHEDLLRMSDEFRRAAEHQRVPGVPGIAGRAAGAERASGGTGDRGGAGVELRGAAEVASSRARITFIPTCRRGIRSRSTTSRWRSTGGLISRSTAQMKRIGVTRVHMEDDAGKSIHDGFQGFRPVFVCGSEPQRHAADRDRQRAGHAQLRGSVCVSHRDEAGDAVSSESRPAIWRRGTCAATRTSACGCKGAEKFGTKAEVKNLNSFRFLKQALDHEIARQVALIESGGRVMQETRLYNPDSGETVGMRSKEARARLPLFSRAGPGAAADQRAVAGRDPGEHAGIAGGAAGAVHRIYGLREYDAQVLTATRAISDYYEKVAEASGDPKVAANWVMGDLSGCSRPKARRSRNRRLARRGWANWSR